MNANKKEMEELVVSLELKLHLHKLHVEELEKIIPKLKQRIALLPE